MTSYLSPKDVLGRSEDKACLAHKDPGLIPGTEETEHDGKRLELSSQEVEAGAAVQGHSPPRLHEILSPEQSESLRKKMLLTIPHQTQKLVTNVLKETQLVNQSQTQRTKTSEDLTMRSIWLLTVKFLPQPQLKCSSFRNFLHPLSRALLPPQPSTMYYGMTCLSVISTLYPFSSLHQSGPPNPLSTGDQAEHHGSRSQVQCSCLSPGT